MEYRALGRTGLRASCLGFGGAPMGIPDYLSHEDRNSQAFRSAGAAFPDLDTAQLTRLAIRFVLSTPEVDCCVVGMRTPAEVAANVELAEDVAGRLDIRSLHNRFA